MKGTWAVEVEELTVKFGPFTAVDHISFSVPPGEIFGFLGANGAGKTTTIRVLCGLLIPTSGRVHVAGRNPAEGLIPVKEKVGYMSQKFTLYEDLSVKENLAFAAALRKLPAAVFAARVKELFGLIGFDRSDADMVRDLPGGVKQEVSLAAALLHDPDVVFLDEPTAGVTPAARARFWSIIRLIARRGKTVFVTTHYMDEAEHCERIAMMREGRIVALDAPAALKTRMFPEPMFEVAPASGASEGWREALALSGAVKSLTPHGMKFHAVVKDEAAWRQAIQQAGSGLDVRRVDPSLEDVFIRVVEEAP